MTIRRNRKGHLRILTEADLKEKDGMMVYCVPLMNGVPTVGDSDWYGEGYFIVNLQQNTLTDVANPERFWIMEAVDGGLDGTNLFGCIVFNINPLSIKSIDRLLIEWRENHAVGK